MFYHFCVSLRAETTITPAGIAVYENLRPVCIAEKRGGFEVLGSSPCGETIQLGRIMVHEVRKLFAHLYRRETDVDV